jgi:hypothetical protein
MMIRFLLLVPGVLTLGCGLTIDSDIPTDAAPWVVRTFEDRPDLWESLTERIAAPVGRVGFLADVRFVDNPRFYGLAGAELVHALPADYPSGFVFAADGQTTEAGEDLIELLYFYPNSTNVADFDRPPSAVPVADVQSIRHLPHVVQELENNLSIANIDMTDVKAAVEPDGIYRGIESPPR